MGGLLIPACVIPTKHDLDKLFQWYPREMVRLPIELKLGQEANPELVNELNPDAIIVASGHGDTPKLPKNVEGLDNKIVCTTMDLLKGRKPKNSLVIGGVYGMRYSPTHRDRGQEGYHCVKEFNGKILVVLLDSSREIRYLSF